MEEVDVEVTDNSEEVLSELQSKLRTALEAVGNKAVNYARLNLENNPRRIDTGTLRDSIEFDYDSADESVTVGTNVEYAPYVHYGTHRMEPNRFLQNAVSEHIEEYRAIFSEYMREDN